jgi:arsenate-mycothiol transferase
VLTFAVAEPPLKLVLLENPGNGGTINHLGVEVESSDTVDVHSAGTRPGTEVNKLSAESLAEIGIDISTETPKPVDPELVRAVDIVVTLGREAHVEPVAGTRFENWDTDEPSERGIDGIQRMRLIRDDIERRMRRLLGELGVSPDN